MSEGRSLHLQIFRTLFALIRDDVIGNLGALWDSFLLAQVPGDLLQILGFAGAKQPTEFVEIQRSSISHRLRRLPRGQEPRRPKPSYQRR
jgi:hypothetical protein